MKDLVYMKVACDNANLGVRMCCRLGGGADRAVVGRTRGVVVPHEFTWAIFWFQWDVYTSWAGCLQGFVPRKRGMDGRICSATRKRLFRFQE